ncbi:MAG: hypothetical protein ACOX7X_09590 [Methanosarcina flavescens]|uniref:hypothetical protein n=1 Tax=Methanosarcina thermophila TaxID=2210 RepID=UPI000B11A8E0|nr:hypothetical protein [Methanosarcina thermophila]NLU57505.1 hypothetical protein [Methanosarcina thermophila]HOA67903.1 hypothetical protein [Methanosarcina thermophila]HOQ66613.1 hypothetical protein [Methanosarcina thermophila]HPT81688.1 hypothetical protein [Methanosarcina thermophila]HPZ19474.1 hypothetical protein [Methanosarcina thermophila]
MRQAITSKDFAAYREAIEPVFVPVLNYQSVREIRANTARRKSSQTEISPTANIMF